MNKELKEAIQAREEFLKKYPHLKSFQEEIDKELNNTNPEERLTKILLMISKGQNKILENTKKIKSILPK